MSADLARLLPEVSPRQRGLDLVVLHRLLLERCLGLTEESIRKESNLRYLREAEEAAGSVESGAAQAAFLVNPIRVEQVREVAFAGEVPYGEVPGHVAAMDIATIPWATDYGSPMKIFEYMAMGKALVAPDLEVLREVLADGRNAVLVERGDPAALARAIERLAADPGLRQALGRAARRDAVERHDWRHHARLIEELAESCREARAACGGAAPLALPRGGG